MKITFKRHQKQMKNMRNRLAELNEELEMLRKEKALSEREAEVKQLIEDLHPAKKHAAIKKIKAVLGDFAEVKKPLKEDVKKFIEFERKRKKIRQKEFAKEFGSKRGKEEKMKHFWEA